MQSFTAHESVQYEKECLLVLLTKFLQSDAKKQEGYKFRLKVQTTKTKIL